MILRIGVWLLNSGQIIKQKVAGAWESITDLWEAKADLWENA